MLDTHRWPGTSIDKFSATHEECLPAPRPARRCAHGFSVDQVADLRKFICLNLDCAAICANSEAVLTGQTVALPMPMSSPYMAPGIARSRRLARWLSRTTSMSWAGALHGRVEEDHLCARRWSASDPRVTKNFRRPRLWQRGHEGELQRSAPQLRRGRMRDPCWPCVTQRSGSTRRWSTPDSELRSGMPKAADTMIGDLDHRRPSSTMRRALCPREDDEHRAAQLRHLWSRTARGRIPGDRLPITSHWDQTSVEGGRSARHAEWRPSEPPFDLPVRWSSTTSGSGSRAW